MQAALDLTRYMYRNLNASCIVSVIALQGKYWISICDSYPRSSGIPARQVESVGQLPVQDVIEEPVPVVILCPPHAVPDAECRGFPWTL